MELEEGAGVRVGWGGWGGAEDYWFEVGEEGKKTAGQETRGRIRLAHRLVRK